MALRDTISIIVNATIGLTGGTPTTFTNDGSGLPGEQRLVDLSQALAHMRRWIKTRVTLGAVAPNANADPKMHRVTISIGYPFADPINSRVYPLPSQVQLVYHPSMTLAQRQDVKNTLISAIADAELTGPTENLVNV